MYNWHLITYNLNSFKLIQRNLNDLGIETYVPVKVKITKRSDWDGVRTSTSPLFPGYIFIKLDPEHIHTSVISKIIGVNDFVRFGGDICVISEAIIDGMKQAFLLRTDKNISRLEYHNLPQGVINELELISQIKSKSARQVAFLELLQGSVTNHMRKASKSSRIVSAIETTYVNKLIK